MKRHVFGFLAITVLTFATQAQEPPARAAKKAARALSVYNISAGTNSSKLHEAVELIAIAVAARETNSDARTWRVQADIYNAIAVKMATDIQLNNGSMEEFPQVENPALTALQGYIKALTLVGEPSESGKALAGLRTLQDNLSNFGNYLFQNRDFMNAYKHFNGVIDAHRLLVANGRESSLVSDRAYQEQLYFTGIAALNAENFEAARPLFEELVRKGYDEPVIYEALYKIASSGADEIVDAAARHDVFAKAYPYLQQGRSKFPDNVSMLFLEINHFMQMNNLDVLIEKLEAAINMEPENVTLYSTLGNVYDNLYQKALEQGNSDKANDYFDKALAEYSRALAKQPGFTDAMYSIGTLFYNRAAGIERKLISSENDYSTEGRRKYYEMQALIVKNFDLALPYFIEVEKRHPADVNTLIALKEIFARKDDLLMSKEFHSRLETVQNGGQPESYFLNK